jgi:tRNA(Ile)-lysidine synthase
LLKNKFANNVKKHLINNKNRQFLLAISGGEDSMCLLDIFLSFQNNYDLTLHVAHINHGLRKEASKDKTLIKNICTKNDIPFSYSKVDIETFAKSNNFSIEEAARIKRYEFLANLANEHNIKTLITAHHADDQIETVLFRFLNGSSIDNLGGIKKTSPLFIDNKIEVFRPFLDIWKSEISDYSTKNKIKFNLDKSNLDNKFTRNKIRNSIIPFLEKEYNSEIKENILQLSNIAKEDSSYFKKELDLLDTKTQIINNELTIDISTLPTESSLRKRSLQNSLLKAPLAKGGFRGIFTLHTLNKIDSLLKQNKPSFSVDLKNNFVLKKENNIITIKKQSKKTNNFIHCIDNVGEFSIPEINKTITIKSYKKSDAFTINKSNNPVYLDASKISFPLTIRSKIDGDTFVPFGQKHSKKLKDYFINKKANRYQRWKIPIFCDNNNSILWVGNYQIDNKFKVTEDTDNILEINIGETNDK